MGMWLKENIFFASIKKKVEREDIWSYFQVEYFIWLSFKLFATAIFYTEHSWLPFWRGGKKKGCKFSSRKKLSLNVSIWFWGKLVRDGFWFKILKLARQWCFLWPLHLSWLSYTTFPKGNECCWELRSEPPRALAHQFFQGVGSLETVRVRTEVLI